MRARCAAIAAAVALASYALPASANDASVLQAKVRAALRSARSFVATVTVKPNIHAPTGGTIVYTVVAPNRYRQQVSGFPDSDDTIIIGNQVYGNKGNGWDVQTWTEYLINGFEGDLLDIAILSVGPDTMAGGVSVGSFTMKDPHGASDSDTLACTFDKTTFRPITCTTGYESYAFARFNDPTVTIATPEHAKRLDR